MEFFKVEINFSRKLLIAVFFNLFFSKLLIYLAASLEGEMDLKSKELYFLTEPHSNVTLHPG